MFTPCEICQAFVVVDVTSSGLGFPNNDVGSAGLRQTPARNRDRAREAAAGPVEPASRRKRLPDIVLGWWGAPGTDPV
jgi:hypothetical protein